MPHTRTHTYTYVHAHTRHIQPQKHTKHSYSPEFLSILHTQSYNVLHMDLAARNLLVSASTSGYVIKVSFSNITHHTHHTSHHHIIPLSLSHPLTLTVRSLSYQLSSLFFMLSFALTLSLSIYISSHTLSYSFSLSLSLTGPVDSTRSAYETVAYSGTCTLCTHSLPYSLTAHPHSKTHPLTHSCTPHSLTHTHVQLHIHFSNVHPVSTHIHTWVHAYSYTLGIVTYFDI